MLENNNASPASGESSSEIPVNDLQYRAFFDLSGVAVCIITPEGRIVETNSTWWNNPFLHPAGLSPITIDGLIFVDDLEYFRKQFRSIAPEVVLPSFESRCRWPENEPRWFEWKIGPVGNGWCFVTARDIHSRKIAADLAAVSLKVYNRLNQEGPLTRLIGDLIAILQDYFRCEAIGIRLKKGDDYPYYQSSGFSAEHLLFENHLCARDERGQTVSDSAGNPVLECMCGNILRGRVDPALPFFTVGGSFWTNSTSQLLVSTTDADRQTHTRNRCNGEGFQSVALIPLMLTPGNIIGLIQLNDRYPGRFSLTMIECFEKLAQSIAMVINHKNMEQALIESELKFRTVADYTFDWEYWLNQEGVFVYISPSCERVTGYTRDDFLKNPGLMLNIIHPEDRAFAQGHLLGRHQDITSIDFRIIHRSGDIRWVGHNCVPVFHSDGSYLGQRANNRDITERKAVERELVKSQQELRDFSSHLQEAIEEEKKLLSHEIHDELGQLLTGLQIDIAWIKKRMPAGNEAVLQKLRNMTALVDQADNVVKNITADLRPVLLEELGLAEALKWLCQQFSLRSGVKCRVTLTPEDFDIDTSRAIDVFRVAQEALSNVSRHSGAGSVAINLEVQNYNLVLEVQDDGRGITPEQKTAGQAYGLIGMHERSRRWQGSLEINGQPGRGTTVKLTIPLNGEHND